VEQPLDTILNSDTKVRVLRLFVSRGEGYQATGREVARLTSVSAPTAHAALKDLYNQHIFSLEIIGRNHLYRLNREHRTIKDILSPAFAGEERFSQDVIDFILHAIENHKLKSKIVSIIFYGSRQTKKAKAQSDVDIAVVVGSLADVGHVEDVFIEAVSPGFYKYFGVSLDVYVKSKKEFIERKKKRLPPVVTLMESYEVIYGEDVIKGKG